MTPPGDIVACIKMLPLGALTGTAHGKRYLLTRDAFNAGRSIKVVARELGGADYISLNLYDLESGPRLYPCEMPAEKVIAFLRSFAPDESAAA